MSKGPPPHGFWTTFGAPLAIGALSLIGLVGALLQDGAWDGLGALLLAAPVIAVAWSRLVRSDRPVAAPSPAARPRNSL